MRHCLVSDTDSQLESLFMHHHFSTLPLGLALLLSSCASSVVVKPVNEVTERDTGAGGILYSLPRTVIVTDATFSRTQRKAPKPHFAIAAKEVLGLQPYKDNNDFALSEVKIATRTEKDPARTYRAQIKQSPFSSHKNSFTFSKDGVLSKSESSSHNRTVEYIVTTVESAAKIAASAAKAFQLSGDAPKPDQLSGDEWKEIQFVLKRIEALDAQKQLLIAGSNPFAATLIEQVEAKLSKEISNFIGSQTVAKETVRIEYTPLTDGGVNAIECFKLFDFAPSKEVESKFATIRLYTSPENSYPKLVTPLPNWLKHTNGAITGADVAEIGLRIRTTPVAPSTANAARLGKGKRGYHYCIPADAKLDIVDSSKVVFAGPAILLPQYGIVAALPASTGSEKTTVKVSLDPDSGALVEASIDAEAFDPKYVQRVGDSINTVVAAEVERSNREASANDELTQLQRQKNILQLKADIAKLQSQTE
jgi:hypothetical protein